MNIAVRISVFMVLVALCLSIVQITTMIKGFYRYEKTISYAWELADKSSLLDVKARYIDEFVGNIESNRYMFADHNAIFLKTPDNNFENNFQALKSLQTRLHDVKNINPRSYDYGKAIEQITAQEQGEAGAMLSTLRGCYFLKNHKIIWGWIGLLLIFIQLIFYLTSAGLFLDNTY